MRVKRLKHAKKHITFYKNTFGFHQPFQILLDLTFCQEALTYKINIKEQIPKYIEGESQLFTTSCILAEGTVLGPQLGGAVHICQQFKLRKCGHAKKNVPADQCIQELIGNANTHHLFVASQDAELRAKLRKIPGVPLLHINYNALVLEKPSRSSLNSSVKQDSLKIAPPEHEQERLEKLKDEQGLLPKKEKVIRITKRIKNPNPLSVKKKQTKKVVGKVQSIVGDASGKKRRKRKHKLAQHVADALAASSNHPRIL